jgi:hypothetical protein
MIEVRSKNGAWINRSVSYIFRVSIFISSQHFQNVCYFKESVNYQMYYDDTGQW